MLRETVAQAQIVSGWKEIANYLGKGVRTVQRYERELGLPVRRPAGKSSGSVIAKKAELDGWVGASPIRDAFQLLPGDVDNSPLLTEFKQHVKELHRLREETRQLREELSASLHVLRMNLRVAIPLQDDISYTQGHLPPDVLTFDQPKKKLH